MTIKDMLIARVRAHLDGNGRLCAELDAAGAAEPEYSDRLWRMRMLSDEELRSWLEGESKNEH